MRFLSQVYTIARGSVGGITYTANQWHQLIARARTSPVQPGTLWQTAVKTAFDGADDLWRLTSPGNKDDWGFYALTCVYQGPLGTYTIPGRQMFIGTRALVGYASYLNPALNIISTDTAPVVAGFMNPGQIVVGTYGGANQGIAVDAVMSGDEAGIIMIDVSIAFNTSRNRFKGPWITTAKTVEVLPASASTHFDIDRPVGTLGQAIFTRIRCFTAAVSPNPSLKHRLSAVFYLRHICEEGPP